MHDERLVGWSQFKRHANLAITRIQIMNSLSVSIFRRKPQEKTKIEKSPISKLPFAKFMPTKIASEIDDHSNSFSKIWY